MDIAGNRDFKCIGRNFSETHLIQAVVIRFVANCRRSIVFQHEVRSRQSDHTHRQRQNADKGLELVLEKITNGNFEVVGEVDPPQPSLRGRGRSNRVIVF